MALSLCLVGQPSLAQEMGEGPASEAEQLKNDALERLQGHFYRGDDLYESGSIAIELRKPEDKTRLIKTLRKAGFLSEPDFLKPDGDHREIDKDFKEGPHSPLHFELDISSPMWIPRAIRILKAEPYVASVKPKKKDGGNGYSVASIAQSADFLPGEFSSKEGQKRLHEALIKVIQRKSPSAKVTVVGEEDFVYDFQVTEARNLIIPGKDFWEKAKVKVIMSPTYLTRPLRFHLDFDYEYAPSSATPPKPAKYRRVGLSDVSPLIDYANQLATELEDYFASNPFRP